MYKYWRRDEIEQSETPNLEFGLVNAIPKGVEAVWGARALTTTGRMLDLPHPRMDILPDRQSLCWTTDESKHALKKLLNEGVLEEMQKSYGRFRYEGLIEDDKSCLITLYAGPQVRAMGDTCASGGYFYVAAWLL